MSIKFKRSDRTYDIKVRTSSYKHGGGLAVLLDYKAFDLWMPFGVLTVNLEDFPTENNNAFVDTNNFGEDIVRWVVENGLGELTGRLGYSGYCCYPEVAFNIDKIKETEVE